ncbi:MAG: methyltransferase domain-containing protein [Armatimonadota bacterium]|nr:MAG: methyltransferase domain-containing protein [Armatimonadota bacterium]
MKADLNRYEDPWTAEVYDFEHEGNARTADVPLWLALAEEAGGPVLELACGTARVTIPLARPGREVTGLDMSPNMLAIARRKLDQEGRDVRARIRLVEGDMRDFSLDQRFPLIIIPFSAFQVLLEREDQRRCLECCARHLKPGGRLAIDVFHPKLSRLTAEGAVEEGPDEFPGPDGVTVRWSGHTDYDIANQRLRSRCRYERTASGGETTVSEHMLELHYFFRFEMEWMLEACGFHVEALYGNFDRNEFAADSPEMIFVARKPDA